MYQATLLLQCEDDQGLLAKLTNFIYGFKGNITSLHEFVDYDTSRFFTRIVWSMDGFSLNEEDTLKAFDTNFNHLSNLEWNIHFTSKRQKMALFVSQYSHCLTDILHRYKTGDWMVDIPLVISNHENLKHQVESEGIPFFYIPISKENKAEMESKELELLKEYEVNCIVLARYMQIVTDRLISEYPNAIINIHHSFLPAFAGANPYKRAFDRGVKIIGATSHYVTADLDQGPIIAQDVIHVSHKESVENLKRKGRDVENRVLADAIQQHLERRILIHNNKSVVFR